MLGDVCEDCVPRVNAAAPWSDRAGALRYLSSASSGELEVLARTAALMLEGGDWWGIHSTNGWVAGLMNGEDAFRHAAATDFIASYGRLGPRMSEAFIWFAADDLATELLYHRGWCPHKPWDKHEADEPSNPIALPGDPELLLLECHCFIDARDVDERSPIATSAEALKFAAGNHPEDGSSRHPNSPSRHIDGSQLPFVGHGVFIRWPVDE